MNAIRTPDKIRKYESIRTWFAHEALSVNFATSAAFATGLSYLWLAEHGLTSPTVGALRAGILAGALVSNILYHKTKDRRPEDYSQAFMTTAQAKTVTRQADTILQNVASLQAQHVLSAALHHLSYAHALCLRTEQSHATAAGNFLSSQGYLPADDQEALKLVLHEACFDLVKHNNVIQVKAQHFIVANFPDLVMVKPTVFAPDLLDSQRLGMGAVVQSLVAMDYSSDEIRAHIRNWADSQGASSEVKDPVELPKDLSL